MKVSRRVAQLGLGAAVVILLASMAIVFVGSTQGKVQTPQTTSFTQHSGQ